jgi:alanine-glyoxylate transaminase/serine-glyoxylate transaminase/serine-pyruvate transaminase
MSLKYGRQMAAIPGPSIIPDRVLDAFSQPMPDLYEGPLVEEQAEVRDRLPGIAKTEGECFIIIGNGHAAWQMATSNTLAAGDKVLVAEAGRFATVWGIYTAVSDVEVEVLPGTDRDPVDPASLETRLREDTGHEIKAVLVAHVDTASSVRNNIPALRLAMDAANHPALLMVDCIASMGCEEFLMDEWGVDIALAGCQKGLMVPPGISFVWAGERALAAHARADRRVGYFDWEARRDHTNMYSYYAGTPPIAHLRAMREALNLIEEEGGIEATWRRHEILAEGVKAAVDAWSVPGGLEFAITDPGSRSNCVTTVLTGATDAAQMRSICEQQAGLIVGLGIAGIEGFRLAHMGHLNPPMILGAIGTIEAALHSMDAPLGGSGVAAAAAAIGQHL